MITLALFGQADSQVFHQFARFHTITEWWQWFALLAAVIAIITYVTVMYRKDCVDLRWGVSAALLVLRLAALLGVLFYFLDFEKREEHRVVRNSRAVVLVDTSLSMGIQDAGAESNRRRIDEVIGAFEQRELLEKMREQHDVTVFRFDQQTAPQEVVALPRKPRAATDAAGNQPTSQAPGLHEARLIAVIAGAIFAISLLSFCFYLLWGRRAANRAPSGRALPDVAERDGSWSLLLGMVTLIAGIVVFAVASLRHPELELMAILGARDVAASTVDNPSTKVQSPEQPSKGEVMWSEALAPRGTETRLGDALKFLINKERGGPIAGIVVLTDGGSNAGSNYQESVVAARAAGVPIFSVGLGSDRRPTNVRIVDLEAPPRVLPGDKFQLTGYVQAFGLVGRSVRLELTSFPKQDASQTPIKEAEQRITLGPDGELIPVKFEMAPAEPGWRTYALRVTPPPQDSDAHNDKSANVQVVERKNRVLLLAGGPTREFQFVRNMLFRDKETTLDVLLQSGVPGISQEADQLLFEFPSLAEEIFQYDCIVAFDPDWTTLQEAHVELLERWVAEKAGGLVLIAGPVELPKLIGGPGFSDRRLTTMRGLYPVSFFSRSSFGARSSSDTPWPIAFTREGEGADFLRLEDDPAENRHAWSSYPGIYGYFAVKDAKPGATVWARFSDPSAAVDGKMPVYLASQFYGAGRVLYQGSGEMWWLRQVNEAYFERYYTKLIRWVSQGRLLRDSSRGLLLVDKDRCLLGETVAVQAVLADEQNQPLAEKELRAMLVHPDGRRTNLPMRRVEDAARPGSYAAQFDTVVEGDYRVELPLPGGAIDELLTREVRARIPTLETERPERNDALLKDLASKTNGAYYVGLQAASNRALGLTPLASLIQPQDQVTYLPGTPDKDFDRLLMTWLMAVICGALCLEWLVRRLSKLA